MTPETRTAWLCEEHYRKRCDEAGFEIPVLLIPNAFGHVCEECEITLSSTIKVAVYPIEVGWIDAR